MQSLSCAPALGIVHLSTSFEHSGNTGENIKRMQGTMGYPKISMIEIKSYEVRPTSHIFQ